MTTDPNTEAPGPLPPGNAPPGPVPATLTPLVYRPDTGRLYWLSADATLTCTPVDAEGNASLRVGVHVPIRTNEPDPDITQVHTILRDIATYTCRPLRHPAAPPEPDGYDEYAVVWVADSFYTCGTQDAAFPTRRSSRPSGRPTRSCAPCSRC